MILKAVQIGCAFLLAAGLAQAEFRTFTNDFGDSVEAELIELKDNGTIISMRLKNGRKIDAAVSAFSSEDKKYIRDWWKEESATKQVMSKNARVRMKVEVRTKTDDQGYKSSYSRSQDVVKVYLTEVTIDNLDTQKFTNNEVRIVFFANDLRRKDQMEIVAVNTIKADFEAQTKKTHKLEAFELEHYEYESSYSDYEYRRGLKYTGYAIMIKNSKGEITHQDATKKEFLNPDLFFKCKPGELYDSKFEHKMKLSSRSSSSRFPFDD